MRTSTIVQRTGIYVVLVAVALVVLFPFFIAFTISLKQSDDVFNYPPTVLPRKAAAVQGGALDGKPLYDLEVEGQTRRVALETDGASVLVLADPDSPADTVLVPTDDVTDTGETVAVDGEERPVVTAEVAGEQRTLVRLRSAVGAVFRDPQDPDFSVVRNVSDAVPVQELTAQPSNYSRVLELQRLDRSLTNTLLVTVLVVVGQVVTSILGGYAFSRMKFAGRDALFLGYIGSVMIPFVVLIIPLYQLMVAIGWVDSLVALVVPFIFSAYGTFLMRQFRPSRRCPPSPSCTPGTPSSGRWSSSTPGTWTTGCSPCRCRCWAAARPTRRTSSWPGSSSRCCRRSPCSCWRSATSSRTSRAPA